MMPILSFFADAPANCTHSFLGMIPWFQYLNFTSDSTSNCVINIDLTKAANWNQLWLIGIALLDDLLRVAGAIAVGFLIYGAIKYQRGARYCLERHYRSSYSLSGYRCR
jgi:hypothetical protein